MSRWSRSATMASTALRGGARAARATTASRARSPWSRASTPRRSTTSSSCSAGFPLAVTIEGHYLDGGLGSLVAEVIAEHGSTAALDPLRRARDAARRHRLARRTSTAPRAVGRGGRPPSLGRDVAVERNERRRLHPVTSPRLSDRAAASTTRPITSRADRASTATPSRGRRCATSSCWCRTRAATTSAAVCRRLRRAATSIARRRARARRLGPRGARGPRAADGEHALLHELRPHDAADAARSPCYTPAPTPTSWSRPAPDPGQHAPPGSGRCSTTWSAACCSVSRHGTSTALRRSSRASFGSCSTLPRDDDLIDAEFVVVVPA